MELPGWLRNRNESGIPADDQKPRSWLKEALSNSFWRYVNPTCPGGCPARWGVEAPQAERGWDHRSRRPWTGPDWSTSWLHVCPSLIFLVVSLNEQIAPLVGAILVNLVSASQSGEMCLLGPWSPLTRFLKVRCPEFPQVLKGRYLPHQGTSGNV